MHILDLFKQCCYPFRLRWPCNRSFQVTLNRHLSPIEYPTPCEMEKLELIDYFRRTGKCCLRGGRIGGISESIVGALFAALVVSPASMEKTTTIKAKSVGRTKAKILSLLRDRLYVRLFFQIQCSIFSLHVF
jgi:hypothetical protein